MGFSLYNDLLDRAVKALKSGKEPALDQPLADMTEVDLHVPALLPEDYLPDVHTRLVMYKRIANAPDEGALRDLQVEMIDRFGLLPEPAKNLMAVSRLRQRAQALGIDRVEVGPGGGILQFSSQAQVDPAALVRMVQEESSVYRLEGQERLRFSRETETAEQRVAAVERILDRITLKEAA